MSRSRSPRSVSAEVPEPSPRAWWLVLLAACAFLLLPLLLVDVPPLHDYPNHLARLFVLAHADDPLLARFYAVRWSLIPNLGIDLLGVPLLRWLPVHVGGRVIVGLALVLPFLGAVACAGAMSGRRGWWALGSALVAYNQAFLLGFLNFSLGVGLALLLAAAWLRWRERFPRGVALFTALGCVGLFFCHLMAVLFLALLVGAHELACMARGPERGWQAIARRVAIAGCVFLPVVLLYLASRLSGEAAHIQYPNLEGKLRGLVAPWVNYVWAADVGMAVISLALWMFLAWRSRWAVSPRAWITLAGVGILYLITPDQIAGLHNVDMRFPILGGFLLFAAWEPARLPRWIMATLGVAFLARIGLITLLWHGHAQTLASFRATIAAVPEGSMVLTTLRPPASLPMPSARRLASGEAADAHLPALLLIERRSWWPFLFDNASQQPVTAQAPLRDLTARIERQRRTARICDLDGIGFVLSVGRPLPASAGLPLLAESDIATLYRADGGRCVRISGD